MTRRIAVVTGGARGLGLAIAGRLAETGHDLVLVDRDESVNEAAESLSSRGVVATGIIADLTVDEDVDAVRQLVASTHGHLDVLVNNAGITRDARLLKMSPQEFVGVIDVNLLAPMRLAFAVEEFFSEGSSVINMSSRAALGNFGQANYVASKSGLIGFTRALALKWAPRVRVNAVAPGLIDSVMSRSIPPEVLDRLVDRVPMGRIGQPEDVAKAVAFLASADASYVTGQVLTVCGGRSVAP